MDALLPGQQLQVPFFNEEGTLITDNPGLQLRRLNNAVLYDVSLTDETCTTYGARSAVIRVYAAADSTKAKATHIGANGAPIVAFPFAGVCELSGGSSKQQHLFDKTLSIRTQ